MARLNHGNSTPGQRADGPGPAMKMAPAGALDLDHAGRGDVAAPDSLSEAWDSLPFFSPSLVDRLWAGHACHDGSTSPQARHHHHQPRHLHVQQLHQQPSQQPHPRHHQQQHQNQREAGGRKRSQPGQKPQPCRCRFPRQQEHQNQPTNCSAPLHGVRTSLESGSSTPAAAASFDSSDAGMAAHPVCNTAAGPASRRRGAQGRDAAAAARRTSASGGGAATATAAVAPSSHGRGTAGRGLQLLSGVTTAFTAAAAAAAGGPGGGHGGGSGGPPALAAGEVSTAGVPCMALVAAAAAAAAAPRALGAAAAGDGGLSARAERVAALGVPAAARRQPPKPPGGVAAPAVPSGAMAVAPTGAAAVPPVGPGLSGCSASPGAAALPGGGRSSGGRPAAAAAEGDSCDDSASSSSCCMDVVLPLPPFAVIAASAAATGSGAEEPSTSTSSSSSSPTAKEQRPRGCAATAALVAMAMSAFEAPPRGHVHNGPRMPLGAGGSPPHNSTCQLAGLLPPQPPQQQQRQALVTEHGAAAGAGNGGDGGVLGALSLPLPAAAQTDAWSARCSDPWVGGWRTARLDPDSPVSQTSTEWITSANGASRWPSVASGLAAWGAAGGLGCERCSPAAYDSRVSLGGESTELALPPGYDRRTQWWGRDLGGGRFNDHDDARLRRYRQYDNCPLPHQRYGGGGGGGGAAGRRPWWRWLLFGLFGL